MVRHRELANSRADTLFGRSREALIGRDIHSLLPAWECPDENLLHATPAQPTSEQRLAAYRDDGSPFPAEITRNSFHTPDGLLITTAILDACKLRYRPIIMTSAAFILGVMPLVVATGAGSEMRQALGTAVFFGMLGVTLFGLLFTPVFYVVMRWVGEKLRRSPAPPSSGEGAKHG